VGEYWLRPLMDLTHEALALLLAPLRWLLF
jgi:hypothetical protein